MYSVDTESNVLCTEGAMEEAKNQEIAPIFRAMWVFVDKSLLAGNKERKELPWNLESEGSVLVLVQSISSISVAFATCTN